MAVKGGWVNSLSILGLTCARLLESERAPTRSPRLSPPSPPSSLLPRSHRLAWFTTYAVLCAVSGKLPSVTGRDVPSRLFAFGGVFGMHRPVVEIIWHVVNAALFGIGALGVCDLFYARHTQARWFALHVIANGWIALLCLPDLYAIGTDPLNALIQRQTVNHWPTSLVFSVHMYHMLFFRNLQFIDWLHHILMVVIGAPLLITGEVGHLMNFNHFFMCGLPVRTPSPRPTPRPHPCQGLGPA